MDIKFSIEDILENGVAEIIGDEKLVDRIKDKSKPLQVKFGTDPTSKNLHIGRGIVIWRLRAFQELGHNIDLIIGDSTAQVGDTSDKESERPMLSAQTVRENMETYEKQLWMILNPKLKDQVKFHYNSTWLGKLTFSELSEMADVFSVNSFIKREIIAKRLDNGSRVSLREMLYPLMQGYDSVVLKSDVELGGTDQRFNLLAGRELQEWKGQKPQSIIMNHLIAGTDGRKMSSSWGNVIALLDTPTDKFGKMMKVADELMKEYLAVYPISVRPFTPLELDQRLKDGENPRDLKLKMAERLVALYHGEDEAKKCEAEYISQFSEGNLPENIEQYSFVGEKRIIDIIVESGMAKTNSEARRLIDQKGVRLDGEVVTEANRSISATGQILNIGKRHYRKLL